MRASAIVLLSIVASCGGRKVALLDAKLPSQDRAQDSSVAAPDSRRPDLRRPDHRRVVDLRAPDACSPWSPVKILFVVDVSGSMQFIDASKRRQTAVQELVDFFATSANVSFAILSYDARTKLNGSSSPGGAFTKDASTLKAAIAGLAQTELLSDLQGALTRTSQFLNDDMAQASSVPKTRYAILILSEGTAEPACKVGCGNDPSPIPFVKHWCDLPRDSWCAEYNPPNCSDMKTWFLAMTAPCLEYNSESLLLAKVKEIVGLKTKYAAGAVTIHTARLVDPLSSAWRAQHGIDQSKLAAFLKQLAVAGGGTYLDLYAPGTKLDALPLGPLCP